MKNLLLATSALFVITFISSNTANAQLSGYTDQSVASTTPRIFTDDNFPLPAARSIRLKIKAVRDFEKSFPKVHSVKWYKTNEGQMAYFSENGIKSRVSYDNHGNCLYTMRSYDETGLSKEIRARVKSNYYDYTITRVNEITAHGNTVYLVRMENATQCKTIRVCEDEDLEVAEEFYK